MLGHASAVILTVAATVTALGVLGRLRPVRWLGRRLISEPFGEWLDERIGAVVDARLDSRPLTNGVGWQTVKAIAEHLGLEVNAAHHEEAHVAD
jgi:hypothetical protein